MPDVEHYQHHIAKYAEDRRIPSIWGNGNYYAFANCASLTKVVIHSTVTEFGDKIFENCPNVSVSCLESAAVYQYATANEISVILPPDFSKFTMPQGLTVIDEDTFKGIQAVNIRLGEKVTTIKDTAFANCFKLKNVYIPASVTDIAQDAFAAIKNLTIYGDSRSYAAVFADNMDIPFEVMPK